MPRYEKAPAEVGQTVERMMDRYHPQLRDAKVSITCLMAFPTTDKNGDSSGPPLRFQGYPAAAIVKIIGLKERTDGRSDVEICIDGDAWPLRSDAEKEALIDHELEHLDLKIDKDGAIVRDDLDRPRLKIRKHDHQHGWFDAIVRRHGRAALEFQQFEEFQTRHYKERWLPFLDSPDTTPVVVPPKDESATKPLDPGAVEKFNGRDAEKPAPKIHKPRGFAGKPIRGRGGARGGQRRLAAAGR